MSQEQPGGDELPSIHAYNVKGMDCPACGHPTLMILDGYITCTLAECPNPDFSETIAGEKEKAVADYRSLVLGWAKAYHPKLLKELDGTLAALRSSQEKK